MKDGIKGAAIVAGIAAIFVAGNQLKPQKGGIIQTQEPAPVVVVEKPAVPVQKDPDLWRTNTDRRLAAVEDAVSRVPAQLDAAFARQRKFIAAQQSPQVPVTSTGIPLAPGVPRTTLVINRKPFDTPVVRTSYNPSTATASRGVTVSAGCAAPPAVGIPQAVSVQAGCAAPAAVSYGYSVPVAYSYSVPVAYSYSVPVAYSSPPVTYRYSAPIAYSSCSGGPAAGGGGGSGGIPQSAYYSPYRSAPVSYSYRRSGPPGSPF